MIQSVCSWALLLSLVFIGRTTAIPFQFDADTGDDCGTFEAEDCRHDESLYFSCPLTCSSLMSRKGSIGSVEGYPDEEKLVYNIGVVASNGTAMSLEDYSGTVTLFAVVPLLPGMAQFHYELLEHLQSIHQMTLQIILQPVLVFNDRAMGVTQTKIQAEDPGILLLQAMRGTTPVPVVDHFLHAKVYTGSTEAKLYLDRVTMFIVSPGGEYVERMISPTLEEIERRIGVYSMKLDSRYRRKMA